MQINVDLVYPIGSIYMTTSTVSPAVLFGGTWERIKGRCIVGVDENDTDFGTVSKTGGEKTHQLTKQELPKLDFPVSGTKSQTCQSGNSFYTTAGGIGTNSFGDQPHNNLQPYYTAYIWRRTA